MVWEHTGNLMIKTQRLLKVPKEVKLRSLLRKEAGMLVVDKKLLPPTGLEQLENLATELLQKLGLDQEYLDFTMVLFGNEIWRNIIAATPFDRRLLLLPQCLKNTQTCQGEMDSLGLICAGCKGCQIDSVLNEAEALGYTTLVAEGTTVAVGLVEEGAIDAVIGVSCMPVLQKSFEPVSRAAVPVMGLPLLYDGCKNTNVDYGWLFEEMHQLKQNSELQPLSVSLLKDQVDDYFTEFNLKRFFKNENITDELAERVLVIGGQRIRPLLTVLAYRSYSTEINEEIQATMAVIIECFHKASLIHDDIEDDDDFRYDQETLHKTHGIPVAINVGDYLIGKGYQLLAGLQVDSSVLAKSLKVVSSSHVNLTIGQGDDLMLNGKHHQLTVDQLLNIYIHKTGEAVKVALLLGAINGGSSKDEQDRLKAFSDWFGIAYQIRDDLNEFRSESKHEHAHHFPFLLALLREKYFNNDERDKLELLSVAKIDVIRELIVEEQVDKHADAFLKLYVDKCYNELDQLQNLKLKLSLYGVMGKIF